MPNDETFAMPESSDGRTREPAGGRSPAPSNAPKRDRRGRSLKTTFGGLVVAAGAIVGCATIADLRDPVDGAPGVPNDGTGDAADTGANATPTGDVVVSPATVDFGDVACGKAPEPKVLRLENQSSEDHAYEVKLPEGTAFSFIGASAGTVKAGDVALVSISVTPRSAEELVTDLAVRIDDRIRYVPLRATGLGGQLDVAPTLVDFGELRAENAESSPIAIVFQNTGNRDLTVSGIDVSNDNFRVTFPDGTPAPAVIAPGASLVAKAVLLNGLASSAELTGTATIETPLACTTPPTISLRGRRGNAKITVTPGTVDIGDVVCKQLVTTKKEVVVSNYENTALEYKVEPLPASSRFFVESGGTGTIPASTDSASPQTATIVVTAKPVDMPAAPVSETLQITFSSGGGGTSQSDVTLTMRPAGVVITADPPDLNYNIFNRAITLTNAGNLPVTLDYKTTSDSDKEFNSTKGSVSVEGGKTGAVNVGFWNGLTPKGETYQATIVLTKKSGGELCTDLPVLKAHTTY